MAEAYFNAQHLGKPTREFVLWLDCMGTQCFMNRSIETAANFIFKFQGIVAKYSAAFPDMHLYPVMDGVYITSPKANNIMKLAQSIMRGWATDFANEKEVYHRCLIRGALAYGDVYQGATIEDLAFYDSPETSKYKVNKAAVLLGSPVIQANQEERTAPPLGIAIHSSCKLSSPAKACFDNEWFVWSKGYPIEKLKKLNDSVTEYFEHYKKQTKYSGYKEERIKDHEETFKQYMYLLETLATPQSQATGATQPSATNEA